MGISRNIVNLVDDIFRTVDLPWNKVKYMTDKNIDELFFPKVNQKFLNYKSIFKEIVFNKRSVRDYFMVVKPPVPRNRAIYIRND